MPGSQHLPELKGCRALVIDPNQASRNIFAAQLKDLGCIEVDHCALLIEGRKFLEEKEYEIVLSEMDFPGGKDSQGAELLDDLRRSGKLPLTTVFAMVTSESTYSRVADAAESALDCYLLKPFSAGKLADRLQEARKRKISLNEMLIAVQEQRFEDAAKFCKERFDSRGPYWLYAARIGAELLLRLGDHIPARQMFEAILAEQALPWARLGVARVQSDAGESVMARRTLESLLIEQPTYVDAYDVMGRAQVENGDLGLAQETYRRAAELTPNSLSRQQKLGMLSFYNGDTATAMKALQRASTLGEKSSMFDHQTTILLAFSAYNQRDLKVVQQCQMNIGNAFASAPKSDRLRRFFWVAEALANIMTKHIDKVVSKLRDLSQELDSPRFDVEAACNMLTLMALLAKDELNLDEEADEWAEHITGRFCGARALTELLLRSAAPFPALVHCVKETHAKINARNQAALTLSMAGDPAGAVAVLLRDAQQTRNGRFLDTALNVLSKYKATIPNYAELLSKAQALRAANGQSSAVPRLGAEPEKPNGGIHLPPKSAPIGFEPPAEVASAAA